MGLLRMVVAAFFCTMIASRGIAQGFYIVDAANGPGSSFSNPTIAAAVVPSGSTLLIRSGAYPTLDISGKSITVLCETGVAFPQGNLGVIVHDTMPNHTVVLRGLGAQAFWMNIIEIRMARGPVVLDGLGAAFQQLLATNADQLMVRNLTLGSALPFFYSLSVPAIVSNSKVVFESCSFYGAHSQCSWGGPEHDSNPAMRIGVDGSPCQVQLSHCSLFGGNGCSMGPYIPSQHDASPAIELGASSAVRISGLATHLIQAGLTVTGSVVPAIAGSGSVRIDPLVPTVPALTSTPQLPVVFATAPSLLTAGGAIGATIDVTRFGAAGNPIAIVVGFPGPPQPWPGSIDPLYLAPGTAIVEAFAISGTSPFMIQKSIPNQLTLRGMTVHWQAIDFRADGSMPWSNPSAVTLF